MTFSIMVYGFLASGRLLRLLDQGAKMGSSSPDAKKNEGVVKMTNFMRRAIFTNVVLTATLILYIVLGGTSKPIVWIIFMPIHRSNP